MPVWIRIWTIWGLSLGVHLVFFLVVEFAGLKREGFGDTLTESVVYLRDKSSWIYWLILDVCFLMAITMAWVIYHFKFWERGVANG